MTWTNQIDAKIPELSGNLRNKKELWSSFFFINSRQRPIPNLFLQPCQDNLTGNAPSNAFDARLCLLVTREVLEEEDSSEDDLDIVVGAVPHHATDGRCVSSTVSRIQSIGHVYNRPT